MLRRKVQYSRESTPFSGRSLSGVLMNGTSELVLYTQFMLLGSSVNFSNPIHSFQLINSGLSSPN